MNAIVLEPTSTVEPATRETLQSLQERLYKDEGLRNAFKEDPVKVLSDQGIDLAPEFQSHLSQFVETATAPATTSMVPGESDAADIRISITIPF
jgi:hypothetical protein